jgi:hypothetical protein
MCTVYTTDRGTYHCTLSHAKKPRRKDQRFRLAVSRRRTRAKPTAIDKIKALPLLALVSTFSFQLSRAVGSHRTLRKSRPTIYSMRAVQTRDRGTYLCVGSILYGFLYCFT